MAAKTPINTSANIYSSLHWPCMTALSDTFRFHCILSQLINTRFTAYNVFFNHQRIHTIFNKYTLILLEDEFI